jgi:pyruvate dehydrogenase E2 component (dihydrolipoamide acetyltransferase)
LPLLHSSTAAAPAPAPAAPAPAAAAPPPPPPPAAAAPAAPAPAATAPAPVAAAPAPRADGRVVATPYAKQLAKDLRVDLATVGGTGPNGRITASDVERAAKGGAAPAAAAPAAAAPAAAAPAAAKAGAPAAAPKAAATTVSELRGTTKPFTTLQAAVARNMNESLKVGREGPRDDWLLGVGWGEERHSQGAHRSIPACGCGAT